MRANNSHLARLAVCCCFLAVHAAAGGLGGFFNGMFIDALKDARRNWRPDACLGAFTYESAPKGVGAGAPLPGQNRETESYVYNFFSPDHHGVSYVVKFSNANNWLPVGSSEEKSFAPRCIGTMPIGIDAALSRARKAGLVLGPGTRFKAVRDRFNKEDIELGRGLPDFVRSCTVGGKAMSCAGPDQVALVAPLEREIWLVVSFPETQDKALMSLVVLDAETGKVLRTR